MFESLFNFVTSITTDFIGSHIGTFASMVSPLIGGCVVLYAMLIAYRSLYDTSKLNVEEALSFGVSLGFCAAIAFSTNWFMSSIVPGVLGAGDEIAQALLGAGQSGGSVLQEMFDKTILQVEKLWEHVSFGVSDSWSTSILMIFLIVMILAGSIPFLAISTAFLLVAKVMVSFLLVMAPLFIMFAFFPSTRDMFKSWTAQCMNYILLTIIFPLAFNFYGATIDYVVSSPDKISIVSVIFTCILFGTFILISLQIPPFCAALTGGVAINGLTGRIGAGMGMIKGSLAKSGNFGKVAGSKLSNVAGHIADRFRNGVKPG
ncbi:type IV secretion system protein [Grimontia sp. SpTr1]|uniref:type IV secretion system protein n=1 Tax=Grimontia sp. SpTr1 TaxID=2995319 RepID=UPI00248C5D2B|nr:type IV secretion system protein [Grimontia sp. SpTr1]